MTNVRLDSFVYTVEGFREAVGRLKPDGLLVVSYDVLDRRRRVTGCTPCFATRIPDAAAACPGCHVAAPRSSPDRGSGTCPPTWPALRN